MKEFSKKFSYAFNHLLEISSVGEVLAMGKPVPAFFYTLLISIILLLFLPVIIFESFTKSFEDIVEAFDSIDDDFKN